FGPVGRPPSAGERLKHVRQGLKMQQLELAKLLGVTQAAVSMAEAGKRPKMAQRLLEKARRIIPEAASVPPLGSPNEIALTVSETDAPASEPDEAEEPENVK
ncbi:MAG: helix-turn-helix transcriptional regulator, partial [Planctomycetota bacterium]